MGELSGAGHDEYIKSLILEGAVEGNILPLTSMCNVRCLFCSHRMNPGKVEVFRIPPRSLEEAERTLSFMDPGRPVVIGESVTRIIEGEPFTHPEIDAILMMVRSRFPRTIIRLTTNGSMLDEARVNLLSSLGNVEVYLSLNSCRELGRSLLMADDRPLQAIKSPELLKKSGIAFHGSVVAMPHLVGWDDLDETIRYLCFNGALTVRVFLPGFTNNAPPSLRFEHSLGEALHAFVRRLRRETPAPVTCEPPCLTGLEAEVAGVMAGSPAAAAGIRCGDVILDVNGWPVLSRVSAFKKVFESGIADITLMREKAILSVRVEKLPNVKSGLVMDYDLDPSIIDDMARAVRRRGVSGVLVLTSRLFGPLLRMSLEQYWQEEAEVKVLEVDSVFFGGSIKAAGLLTLEDFSAALDDYLTLERKKEFQLALLPGQAFDKRGRDLTRRSYLELQERFGITFEIL